MSEAIHQRTWARPRQCQPEEQEILSGTHRPAPRSSHYVRLQNVVTGGNHRAIIRTLIHLSAAAINEARFPEAGSLAWLIRWYFGRTETLSQIIEVPFQINDLAPNLQNIPLQVGRYY